MSDEKRTELRQRMTESARKTKGQRLKAKAQSAVSL